MKINLTDNEVLATFKEDRNILFENLFGHMVIFQDIKLIDSETDAMLFEGNASEQINNLEFHKQYDHRFVNTIGVKDNVLEIILK